MTEKQWRTGKPKRELSARMLEVVRGRGSDRQFRLVVCGELRQHSLGQAADWLEALELGELWADGRVTDEEILAFNRRTGHDTPYIQWGPLVKPAIEYLEIAIRSSCGDPLQKFPPLFREVFGNPFRPISLSPALRTLTVVSLAEAAYEERDLPSGHLDPARLAVLADSLEEAGCTEAELVGHLRQQGAVHVRGCWCVDLLLGKS